MPRDPALTADEQEALGNLFRAGAPPARDHSQVDDADADIIENS